MKVLLKGSPFNGSVQLSCHGPFHTEKEAIDWAVKEWEGEPEWFVMDVEHTSDYNSDDLDEADEEPTHVDPIELERLIRQAENVRKSKLPKEIMLDLSEIPVGI